MNNTNNNQKKFYWNDETLQFFKELKDNNEKDFKIEVTKFVENECDLENNETFEMLTEDLINQINQI